MVGDRDIHITWASERHLRIAFEGTGAQCEKADTGTTLHSMAADVRAGQGAKAVERARIHGLISITPAASTIVLEFEPAALEESAAVEAVRRAISAGEASTEPSKGPMVEIPVCYESPFAPDAGEVARFHRISVSELIDLHSKPVYVVQFIGFAPGFGYLNGLPPQLATPRLATPRVRVPAGSVGIAGDQTGVYPCTIAGGWRLIGRTPTFMFDAAREKPSLLAAGDRVQFRPISKAEFNELLRGGPDHA